VEEGVRGTEFLVELRMLASSYVIADQPAANAIKVSSK
jgi:hypothetical protein